MPLRYRTWVLYDATCSTWVVRHLVRLLTVTAFPVAAVIGFVPGPLHVRVLTAVAGGAGAYLFTAVWVNEATDYRLARAGWRGGLGPELRRRRVEFADWMSMLRRL